MQNILSAMPSTAPWYETWFDTQFYQSLYSHRNAGEAAAFIDRLKGRLLLPSDSAVLDLGCGAGRHARQLAACGFQVLGIDLSSASIQEAKQHEGRGLAFCWQDMRLPFGVRRFDAVFNLFTSFGYFDDPADDLVVVENIARALKPDGLLVLDYLNARVAERNLRPIEVVVRHGALFQITRWTGATHLFKRIECHEGATSRVFVEQVAKLTLEDFQFLFHLCGLKLEAIYGDYQLNLFDPDLSPRLILIARKAGENSPVDLTAGAASAHATQGLWRNAQI